METFNFETLIGLSNEEFESKFKGKRIRVTSHGKTTEGTVSGFSLSLGSKLVTGFIFGNKDSVDVLQDIIVEILN